MEWLVKTWWRGNVLPRLRNGDEVIPRTDMYAFIEILHALRDNVSIDLRQDFRSYFATLPTYLLLSYYPAVYPASENEFHIPVIRDGGEPDLKKASMARAADLALVAYDPNATESQFLQGWSMQDRFLMRGPLGITYEFLWANPYLPGLSFYSAPLVFHDEGSGRLIVRSGWDGDAAWFHLRDGVMQTFADGRIVILDWDEFTEPMDFGGAVVWPLKGKSKFTVSTTEPVTYFLTGLEADHKYDIEVDDEGLFEKRADHGGVLALEFPADREVGVRVSKSRMVE